MEILFTNGVNVNGNKTESGVENNAGDGSGDGTSAEPTQQD